MSRMTYRQLLSENIDQRHNIDQLKTAVLTLQRQLNIERERAKLTDSKLWDAYGSGRQDEAEQALYIHTSGRVSAMHNPYYDQFRDND